MTATRHVAVVVLVVLLSSVGAVACAGDDTGDGAVSGSAGSEPPAASTSGSSASPGSASASTPSTTASPPVTATDTSVPSSVATLEPLLASLDPLQVLGPTGAELGPTPAFEWEPVAGAESYRLVVLGPDGPIWAWEGPETKIWLGGFGVEPAPGATRLAIVAQTCWSVVALDAERSVVAASPLLPISPSGEATHTCTPDG